MQQYDFAVVIGSFEPFHLGHKAAIDRALAVADRVVVLIGSAGFPRSPRHPWSGDEREAMIRAVYPELSIRHLIVRKLADRLYNELQWVTSVQEEVGRVVMDHVLVQQTPPQVALIESANRLAHGHLAFPEWDRVEIELQNVPEAHTLRNDLLRGPRELATLRQLQLAVPEPVFAVLRGFVQSAQCAALVEEMAFIDRFRNSWKAAPYPPVFVTTDAVVVHSGHLLLVQRGHAPGCGLWALPGGFIDQDETIYESCLRELREETAFELPAHALRAALEGQRVFDAPHRSLRGRTITHAFFFHFPEGELPAVKGGDDAAQARWFRLARLGGLQDQMFEDHYHIVDWFLGSG